MTETREPSPEKATGQSGVTGGRRDAGVPSGSSVPDEIQVRPPEGPTTQSLGEMVSTDDADEER